MQCGLTEWGWHVSTQLWGGEMHKDQLDVRVLEILELWKLWQPQIRNQPEVKGAR